MKKSDVIRQVLGKYYRTPPNHTSASAFAPTNIALCKYWGKRNRELNLPMTSSLSISLSDKGATIDLKINDQAQDVIFLNGQTVDLQTPFAKRLIDFLNLFRVDLCFDIHIQSTIPIAAGLASSACGFASVTKALDQLYGWELSLTDLSILARLGSGSASRSLWNGFVEWHAGTRADGLDSHGEGLNTSWPDLCIGLVIMNKNEKNISSREAMQRTVETSALYSAWPTTVARDLILLKEAIASRDFDLLGKTAESNALAMHATMLSAWPPVSYAIPETLITMQKIWELRHAAVSLYFTQDAGPNLKLLFLQKDSAFIKEQFPSVSIVQPFC